MVGAIVFFNTAALVGIIICTADSCRSKACFHSRYKQKGVKLCRKKKYKAALKRAASFPR